MSFLYLVDNQLTGSIPSSLGNLSNLNTFDLALNELNGSIPSSLDSFLNPINFGLAYNQFTFAGMEGIATSYSMLILYSPQADIPLNFNAGKLSVSAGGTLANDTFHWYKDNVLYTVTAGDSILTVTENGNYSVAVTNAIATELTLYSDTVMITSFPVTLLSFTATKQATQNLLQWATTQEINSSYFAVQRSSDGVNFTTLGQVNAAGNSSATNKYTYTDTKPTSGTNYYRLKMVDKDGQFTYSPIRTINETVSFAASIYPNPVQNNLNLNFNSDKASTVQVEIINNEGKTIATQQIDVAAGASTQSVNTTSLSNGVYYARLVTADGEIELKFVKER